MRYRSVQRLWSSIVAGAALGGVACAVEAAPTISRLTPPSEKFATGNDSPVIARFLSGQRFDLQATVRPDAGTTVSSVSFKVDGATVATVTTGFSGNRSLVPATAIIATAPNSVAASVRAYSNTKPGMHTLTASATQSDGSVTTATGNFEVVRIAPGLGKVKNVIIMLGDGMGAAHRTAARIMSDGYAQGKAKGRLAMDMPVTGMVMTASLNSIVTDSAPGMANYVNGNKAANNQEGVFPDDTTDTFDNPRVEYLSEYLHRLKGTSLGIVTTADVFDATPAANAVHTSNRGNGTGITDQYLDDRNLTGLTVLLGGGRKWFLPNASNSTSPQNANGSQRRTSTDYVLPGDVVAGWGAATGKLDADRNLIGDFEAAGFQYAADKAALDAATDSSPLLGLFAFSNMNVAKDKIDGRRSASSVVDDYGFPDQPMLDEMTGKALEVLASTSPNGFILMAEGASIDKQAHLMDSERWMLDTIEFDRAVGVARNFAKTHPGTLVIVTADHECSGAAIIGASTVTNNALQSKNGTAALQGVVGVYDAAGFPKYTLADDGYPQSTDIDNKMLIGYGGNADRYEDWQTNAQPIHDTQQPFEKVAPLAGYPGISTNDSQVTGAPNRPIRDIGGNYFIAGQVAGEQAVHTASDIPLSAYGRGAYMFTGVMDNTDVFFKLGQAALGGVLSINIDAMDRN